jgi:DNA-3-methyladenine glycosylase II
MAILHSESDLKAAAGHLKRRDKVLAKLIKQHGICRIQPWTAEPCTALIGSIISQQISVKAADTINARALKLAGRGGRFSATKLSTCDEESLRACGLSGAKARYVLGIAEAVITKQIDLKKLRSAEEVDVIKQLTQLKGVGKWTAEMLMIFAYGHADVLSLGDWGLRRGAHIAYQLEQSPSDKVFSGMAEIWRPYRSVASWYLWRAAESGLPD